MISNNPPPEATYAMAIDDLYDEARNFIDGTPIESQGQADSVGKIVSALKEIKKAADTARSDEKRPHDDAGKAVQAKWKPLLEKADRAITAATKPLTDYLLKLEAERRAEAERLADAARVAQIAAQDAQRNAASLDDAERADALVKEAAILDRSAKRTDKAKSNVTGVNRAIGLRTYWIGSVTDFGALLSYMKQARPDDLKAMLSEYARSQVSAGARHIPGVLIEQEKRAA